MRRVFTDRKPNIKLTKSLTKDKIFVTVNSVLQPLLFDETEDGITNKTNVFLTPQERIFRRSTAKNQKPIVQIEEVVTTTTTTPQRGTVTTTTIQKVDPIVVFQFFHGVRKVDSNNFVEIWQSSFGRNLLRQETQANKPTVGIDGRGVVNENAIFFDSNNTDKQFMSLADPVTLTDNFTLFFYICPKKVHGKAYVNMALLGKSDDNNMFLSIGEATNEAYKISYSASASLAQTITAKFWTPTFDQGLITVIRKDSILTIRENGVVIFSEKTNNLDFTFDQFGRIGNGSSPFNFHGLLYHFSAFDFALETQLESIENKIIKESSRSRDALDYKFVTRDEA